MKGLDWTATCSHLNYASSVDLQIVPRFSWWLHAVRCGLDAAASLLVLPTKTENRGTLFDNWHTSKYLQIGSIRRLWIRLTSWDIATNLSSGLIL